MGSEMCIRDRVVTRLLSRWQMREVSACFSAWCDDVQSAHMRAHSAICRSVSVVTSDAEGHVGAESVAQYRVGQIVEVFETRLVKGRLRGRTAEGWVWYVLENGVVQLEEMSREEIQRVRTEQAVRKAAFKIQNAKVASAFDAWTSFASSSKRMRYVAGRVVLRMQQGVLAGALGGWSEYVAWSVRSKGIVDRMLLKWTQQGLARALLSWREWTVASNQRKRGLRKAVLRMEHAGMSSAFDTWRTWTASTTQLRSSASRVVARLRNSALLGAYGRWCEYWEKCRLVRRVTTRMSNMRTSRSIQRWLEAVDMWIAERQSADTEASLSLIHI